MITNSLGEVVSRRDFKPFGEHVAIDGTYRSADLTYNSGDGIRQKFTGYQKDEETQLDFAEARMYESRHGRFTAVDPLISSGKSANPQTFNRYVYVVSNPLLLNDPFGLQAGKWYERKDGTGDYVYHYSWNPPLNDDYGEVTRRNRNGDLITDPTNQTHVYRLNPNGPYLTPTQNLIYGVGWQVLLLTDYARLGYESITSDWYEDTFAEHPADGYAKGSEMAITPVDLAAIFTPFKFSVVGRGLSPATDSAKADALSVGQAIVDRVSARLAENPGLARDFLSPAEYEAGQNSVQVARMQYGNAVERMFWDQVDQSPRYQQLFQRLGGPSRADGVANGQLFDITTRNPFTVQRHFARSYGQGLRLFQYDRPASFTLFQ